MAVLSKKVEIVWFDHTDHFYRECPDIFNHGMVCVYHSEGVAASTIAVQALPTQK